jgi:hypothetical protein
VKFGMIQFLDNLIVFTFETEILFFMLRTTYYV